MAFLLFLLNLTLIRDCYIVIICIDITSRYFYLSLQTVHCVESVMWYKTCKCIGINYKASSFWPSRVSNAINKTNENVKLKL